MRTRKRLGLRLALAAAAVGGVAVSGGGVAHAVTAIPTFKWTGTDDTAGSPNSSWSDPNNWSGGVAPSAPGPVDLVFPALTCAACRSSNNDLTGLTVAKLSITGQTVQQINKANGYTINGSGITLDGMAVTTSGQSTGYLAFPEVSLPIVLGQAEKWTFSGIASQTLLTGQVTGLHPLNVVVSQQGSVDFDSKDNVGAVTITGKIVNSVVAGGFFVPPGDSLNTNGRQVKVVDAETYIPGGTVGPFSATGSTIDVGNGQSPYGIMHVKGAASSDSTSTYILYSLTPGNASPPAPKAGVNYPQIAVTGAFNPGSAPLSVSADCNQALGVAYTLVTAGGGLTGSFDMNGSPLTNGEIVQAQPAGDSACSGSGATPPYLQYSITATTITATTVAPPPGAPAARGRSQPATNLPVATSDAQRAWMVRAG